jgi:hypothetical protein
VAAAAACAGDLRVGATVGAGWFTAPAVSTQAEGLRPTFVVVLDGWVERGPFSLGLEAGNNLAVHTRSPSSGLADEETLWLSSVVGMVGRSIALADFPATVRLAAGAGGVHVWNRLDRGAQRFVQRSWGPEFHLVGLWERELGRRGLILVRLAGIHSSTFRSEIEGTTMRSRSDWSRVEFSMGWSWRS